MLHNITSHLMTTNNFVDKHLNVTCVIGDKYSLKTRPNIVRCASMSKLSNSSPYCEDEPQPGPGPL